MNRAEIRGLARATLNESTEKYWLNADLNAWLNDGIREVNQQLRVESNGSTTGNTVAGTATIVLPSSAVRIVTVRINNAPLNKTTLQQVAGSDMAATGTPTHYYMTRSATGVLVFNLWPVPDGAYPYTIWTVNELAELAADSDTPALPPRWHGAFRYKILGEAYAKGGRDYGAASAYSAEWTRQLRQMVADLLNTQDDGYTIRYVDPAGEGGPATFDPLS